MVINVLTGAGVENLTVSAAPGIAIDIANGIPIYPPYEGATQITPNDNEQTLQTAGRYIPGNIVVSRIPQTEYAHITYDHLQNIRVW